MGPTRDNLAAASDAAPHPHTSTLAAVTTATATSPTGGEIRSRDQWVPRLQVTELR